MPKWAKSRDLPGNLLGILPLLRPHVPDKQANGVLSAARKFHTKTKKMGYNEPIRRFREDTTTRGNSWESSVKKLRWQSCPAPP
ncbi:hypothetical protein HYPGJ_20788 [Hyphomicrobium sp. GJ21]|nr:hypothetical protein HYPGJ_20788 [Hyphomicrobium sp. GJ21]